MPRHLQGFLNSKTFHLHNTSEIPMRFSLRVPEGTDPAHKEFAVIPASGVVLPHGKQRLALELASFTVKTYDLSLQIDIDAVGTGAPRALGPRTSG